MVKVYPYVCRCEIMHRRLHEFHVYTRVPECERERERVSEAAVG
jgi:hypothetical protein